MIWVALGAAAAIPALLLILGLCRTAAPPTAIERAIEDEDQTRWLSEWRKQKEQELKAENLVGEV